MGTESGVRRDEMEAVAGQTQGDVRRQPRSKEQVKNEAEILTWKISPKQQELPLKMGEGKSLSLRRSHLQRKKSSQKREKVVEKRGISKSFHFTD